MLALAWVSAAARTISLARLVKNVQLTDEQKIQFGPSRNGECDGTRKAKAHLARLNLNLCKCKCLHIGRANGKEPYEMHNTVLLKTSKEKDLGVTISADWKVSEQCGIAARKGNQLLGMIKRNIT